MASLKRQTLKCRFQKKSADEAEFELPLFKGKRRNSFVDEAEFELPLFEGKRPVLNWRRPRSEAGHLAAPPGPRGAEHPDG